MQHSVNGDGPSQLLLFPLGPFRREVAYQRHGRLWRTEIMNGQRQWIVKVNHEVVPTEVAIHILVELEKHMNDVYGI